MSDAALTRTGWTLERARSDPSVTWKDDTPYLGERRLILPNDDVDAIIRDEYARLPPAIGYLRLYSILKSKYARLPRKSVQDFLSRQEGRQLYRRPRNRVASRAQVVTKPGRVWTADIKVLPKTRYKGRTVAGIFVIVDNMSKYVFASPIKSESQAELIRCSEEWLVHIEDVLGEKPAPRMVKTDNGTGWGEAYTEWLKGKGIRHVKGPAYHPQAQGIVERANQTLGAYLVSWADQKFGSRTRWPELLPQVLATINTSWNRITKISPRQVLRGENTQEVAARIRSEGKKRKFTSLYDDQPLRPGDHVRVSMRADGPARIKGQIKISQRKVGSEHQWVNDRGDSNVRVVKRRINRETYMLEDDTKWDRADLLKVPGPNPERYPRS